LSPFRFEKFFIGGRAASRWSLSSAVSPRPFPAALLSPEDGFIAPVCREQKNLSPQNLPGQD